MVAHSDGDWTLTSLLGGQQRYVVYRWGHYGGHSDGFLEP